MITTTNEEEEKQAFELQSTKEGLESIVAALNAQSTASTQLSKAFKQQAMLYDKTDPLHTVLSDLAISHQACGEQSTNLQSLIGAQINSFNEFLQVTRKEYLGKKAEYESKQTKLQKSKHETPELQQAVDASLEDFQTFSSHVYKVKLDALLKSNVFPIIAYLF